MHVPTIVLDFAVRSGWDRGVVQGITEFGSRFDWNILLSSPNVPVAVIAATWNAEVVVSGCRAFPELERHPAAEGRPAAPLRIAVGNDLCDIGIPSIQPDDHAVGVVAARYLTKLGLSHLAIFGFNDDVFARERAAGFRAELELQGMSCNTEGAFSNDPSAANFCSHEAIIRWLTRLHKPCGVFALCDDWSRFVATYCRHLKIRIPEDVALIGVDDDKLVCELSSPPLSSVAIPWREIGRKVVQMIGDHLAGEIVPVNCIKVMPSDVVSRRSTDVLSIEDTQVAQAVAWIRQNAHRVLGVDDVVRAVQTYRQRLERQFRTGLGRTVMEEVRRAHVELARNLLQTTDLPMPEIAARCGFTNATLMGITFRKEVGQTPREYRRRCRGDVINAGSQLDRPPLSPDGTGRSARR